MEEVLEKYLRAGRIANNVLTHVSRMVRPGVRVLELCEEAERKIFELGGRPAFPVNISINNVAAHYTSPINDPSTIPENSIVKIDVGVHVDGYIADTALTIDLSGEREDLVFCVEEALENVIEAIYPGIRVSKIGEIIGKTIRKYGFNPIKNLSGHSLDRYMLHAGLSIPNFKTLLAIGSLKPWKAYAIEPFATNGIGVVEERGEDVFIYSLPKPKKAKGPVERKIITYVKKNFNGLPFSERWLLKLAAPNKIREVLRELVSKKVLVGYPVLVEASGGLVSQREHTILVLPKEIVVTTL